MTVAELRDWLHLKEGELVKISHLQARVLEQARKELDRKCPLSFVYDPLKEGRKITGWRFSVVDNKPFESRNKRGRAKVSVEAAEAEGNARDKRYSHAKSAWQSATAEQRANWLAEMPHAAILAPKENDEPRTLFLDALTKVLEPELPL